MAAGEQTEQEVAWRGHNRLYRRIYPFRILGMGLGGLPGIVGLIESQAGIGRWALQLFICGAWPHLAYLRAKRSADPYRSEVGNLLVDSLIAGMVTALTQFNPLAGAVLLTVATVDKINSGVRGLWQRSMPWMLAGLLLGGVLTGFRVQLQSSLWMVLACLPMLVIHVVAVSINADRLMRKVHHQNRELDELSSVDRLTRVQSRARWEQAAAGVLAQARSSGMPASLVIVDVDGFKQINDGHGHAVGDDALVAVASVLRRVFGDQAQVGRLGGDEFTVALAADPRAVAVLADEARRQVTMLQLDMAPALRCEISCGIALAGPDVVSLRDWLVRADRALYRAKQTGRNRVECEPADAC